MFEIRRNGHIYQLSNLNMTDDPDYEFSLNRGTGWVGMCLDILNGTDRTKEMVVKAASGSSLTTPNLQELPSTDLAKTFGLNDSELNATRHIAYIHSYPIRLWMGRKGATDFYCPGLYNLHYSRPELNWYFKWIEPESRTASGVAAEEEASPIAQMLYNEIDATLRGVRDTLERFCQGKEGRSV